MPVEHDKMMARRWGLLPVVASLAFASGALHDASVHAQEVVQAIPPAEAAQLSAALRRLAARPTDLEALISAGNASLVLRDIGAASGFFTRAAVVAPSDRRVMLGQARVALEQQRPVAALQGFAQAEAAGLGALEMAADRGLAYDLVGDNAAAQTLYRAALAADERNTEVRRRLALSLAISGNRSEFERVLYPMLRDEDRAAYRTRAFGLAVLGRPDEAVAIADAMMSTDLALRMAPYLRYMPRLTKAQQAAAANLGAFPAAADIGRDSAEIASYASAGARIAANASASLTPAGAPLGQRSQSSRMPASGSVKNSAAARARVAPAKVPTGASTIAAQQAPTRSAAVGQAVAEPAAQPVPVVSPRVTLAEAFADLGPTPSAPRMAAAGAVDIAALTSVRNAAAAATAARVAVTTPAAEKPKPKPKVEKPAEPARHWIQIGVGRNTGAFSFDWRKLARQAGGVLDDKGPWAVKYGVTNRMLAGPYASEGAVRTAIGALKEKGIDALPFASAEGEKVTKIG